AYIKGTIIDLGNNFLIIENQGLGYKVYSTNQLIQSSQLGQDIAVFLHHNLKEDSSDLYGFVTKQELLLFQQLISVSGIGPKTALGVFAVSSVLDIHSAIASQDSSMLKKVSGIGAKTADRIILELKNKISFLDDSSLKSSAQMEANSDAIDTLTALGYSTEQARQALSQIPNETSDLSEKIKLALQYLTK
ncbi:Holliday junction DNA helicase RuvA, partial [Candidatus Falkowbacteria bacterium RIFOXYC2_FULL_36_12]